MKLLVIGPRQSAQAQSAEAKVREAMQAKIVERYMVYTPHQGEPKFQACMRILRDTTQEDFDTVSAQDPFFVGLVAWRVARRHGARFNVQVHTDLSAQGIVRRTVARLVLCHADSIRVVSDKIKKQVGKFGVKAPITILPLFVDLAPYTAVVRAPQPGVILWIGRFEDEKNPMLAIEVLKKIRGQGTGASLVMLGTGSLELLLRAAAKDLPVDFPGWQSPFPYLAKACVVLCTSKNESWGLSIVEALAAGVPVVAPDVGVAAEAGAIVVMRSDLASAVEHVLETKAGGRLAIQVPSKSEWVRQWLKSL